MIMTDTGFWIALLRRDDSLHSRADELALSVSESGESLALTEAVLGEFVTFMCRNDGPEAANRAAARILDTDNVVFMPATLAEVIDCIAQVKARGFYSYADALQVAVMESRNIKRVLSFDSDFDRVKGIKRVY